MSAEGSRAGRSVRISAYNNDVLRCLAGGSVDAFAASAGEISPISPTLYRVGTLVVLGSSPTCIAATPEEPVPPFEVFPISPSFWRPETHEPWWYNPPVAKIDPNTADGLDLTTPLGRSVEISILSMREPYGEDHEPIEIDTGLVLAVDGWRLLVESLEHTDHAHTLST
jgi:hypothetical protein